MQGKPGDFLVAHPLLEDENFERSVVLLTQWDDHGASGLIVNRLSDYTLDSSLARRLAQLAALFRRSCGYRFAVLPSPTTRLDLKRGRP